MPTSCVVVDEISDRRIREAMKVGKPMDFPESQQMMTRACSAHFTLERSLIMLVVPILFHPSIASKNPSSTHTVKIESIAHFVSSVQNEDLWLKK